MGRLLLPIVLLLFFRLQPALGQWTNVAPKLITVPVPSGGAMYYGSGRLWVGGVEALFMSSDDGVTWKQMSIPMSPVSSIYDIDFLDKNNGVVSTSVDGLFITNDGGASWKQFDNPAAAFYSIKFVGVAKTLIGATGGLGQVYRSTDGGASWVEITPKPAAGDAMVIAVDRASGTVYGSFLQRNINSHVLRTTDLGTNWSTASGTFNYDSYGFALDPCNPQQFYVANEGTYVLEADRKGRMLYSSDGGTTITASNLKSLNYYCGSVVCAGGGTAYAQTLNPLEGVIRSTDHGQSWTPIDGPNGLTDTHMICVKNDNTVFAVGRDGSVWRTTNSGGSPVSAKASGALSLSAVKLFERDTVSDCDSLLIRSIRPISTGCQPPSIVSVSISGSAKDHYSLIDSSTDTIRIGLLGGGTGPLPATLHCTLSAGSVLDVSLLGTAKVSPFVLEYSPLKYSDTVVLCDTAHIFILLSKLGCGSPSVLTESITGLSSSDYNFVRHAANPVDGDDTVEIIFTPQVIGAHPAQYELQLANGSGLTFGLDGYSNGEAYMMTFSPPLLSDTVSLCDSALTRTIKVSLKGCVTPLVVSQSVTGPGAADYTIDRRIGFDPSNGDSAIITFHPSTTGDRSAVYRILLSDSSVVTFDLHDVGRLVPMSVSSEPASLADSVFVCDPPFIRTIRIGADGCPEATIVSQTIQGPDASNYTILRACPSLINGTDSAIIAFDPLIGGRKNAEYVITFSDSTLLRIPFADKAKVVPFVCTPTPSTLFAHDSLFSCDPSLAATATLITSGCPQAHIVSQRVVGPGAGDYLITRVAADSIESVDSVGLQFLPTATGVRDATLVIAFDNGDTVRILLNGVGREPSVLRYTTSDDSTTEIGGTIDVPIRLAGLETSNLVEFVLHYLAGQNLEYDGSFDAFGNQLDLAGEQWPGRSKLRLRGPVDANAPPHSSFRVFADTAALGSFSYDSLVVVDAASPCAFEVATASTSGALYVAPLGCGSQEISRYLHYGTMPQLSIVPNPASTSLSIKSRSPLDATIEIVDALGRVVLRREHVMVSANSRPIDMSIIAEGIYIVRVATTAFSISQSVIVER